MYDKEGDGAMTNMKKSGRRPAAERRKSGETLTETLIAMLIIGLSSVLFLTMVGASGRIFRTAKEQYKTVYDKIAEADTRDTECSNNDAMGEVKVVGSSSVTVNVKWYGDTDYVFSYEVG